jgi:hypothetical protein
LSDLSRNFVAALQQRRICPGASRGTNLCFYVGLLSLQGSEVDLNGTTGWRGRFRRSGGCRLCGSAAT